MWPSGLRRRIKAPISSEPWVQIPSQPLFIKFLINMWIYSVMVITSDSESDNPGSNPGRSNAYTIFIVTNV